MKRLEVERHGGNDSPRSQDMASQSCVAQLQDVSVFDRRELDAALLRIASPLDRRPNPRWMWDRIAAGDHAVRNVHLDVALARQALSAGQKRGEEVLSRVRNLVSYFFRSKETIALEGYAGVETQRTEVLAAQGAALAAHAAHAVARWSADPNRVTLVRAEEQVLEAIAVLDACSKKLLAEINTNEGRREL